MLSFFKTPDEMEVMVADLAPRIRLGQESLLQHGEDKLLVETGNVLLRYGGG